MIARPLEHEPETLAGDPIASWLGVLERFLRLPPAEAREIRDELDSHLRERVRDLMIEGRAEADAVGRAIAELGEAADLARRFRGARRARKRRFLMNVSMLALAGGAMALSLVAVTQPGAGPAAVAVFQEQPAERAGPRVSGQFSERPLAEVLSQVAQAAAPAVLIRWRELESAGLRPDMPVTVSIRERELAVAIEILNDVLQVDGPSRLDARLVEGSLEIATAEFFDLRERILASYSLRGVINDDVTADEVRELVVMLVEPELWEHAGGIVASIYALGDRLFVNAPPRMQRRVAWILGQLGARDHAAVQPPAPQRDPLTLRLPPGEQGGWPVQISSEEGQVVVRFSDPAQTVVSGTIEMRGLVVPPPTAPASVPVLSDLPQVGHLFR